ncbi:O-antigen ligase family protein [Primorskyibacter aestuariivivens]|uniref:O-antigen ligase family protein n=1 Tax=Primorskyibacter aestuariivivens TaxID=1888912 RepID=UPI0022FFDC60|nr:O-antigen ligase family protein [Primorskyibacter aestuariivivens]MDA7429637.1 O-antigen ligase family protein [Primorskyibacter aestuariivivens]
MAVATTLAFFVLLRVPEFAATGLALCILLNLPYVLPAFHGMDFVLAALLVLAFSILLSSNYLGSARTIAPQRYAVAAALWLSASLLSVALSVNPADSYESYRYYIPYVVLCGLMLWLIGDLRQLSALYTGLIAGTVLLASLAVIQRLFHLEHVDFGGLAIGEIEHISGKVEEIRPGGPLEDANFFASYMIPGALLSAARAVRATRAVPLIVYGVATLLILGGVLVTASRGGAVSLGVGLVVLLVLERRIWPWIGIAAAVVVLLASRPEAYLERFSLVSDLIVAPFGDGGRDAHIDDPALAGRLGEMQAAVYMFLQNPVTGVGYSQFESNFQTYVARNDILMRNEDRGAHSLYLEAAAETGLVGLAALGFLLISGLLNLRETALTSRAAGHEDAYLDMRAYGLGALAVFLAHAFLHDAKAQYFWLFVSLLYVSPRVLDQVALRRPGAVGGAAARQGEQDQTI